MVFPCLFSAVCWGGCNSQVTSMIVASPGDQQPPGHSHSHDELVLVFYLQTVHCLLRILASLSPCSLYFFLRPLACCCFKSLCIAIIQAPPQFDQGFGFVSCASRAKKYQKYFTENLKCNMQILKIIITIKYFFHPIWTDLVQKDNVLHKICNDFLCLFTTQIN